VPEFVTAPVPDFVTVSDYLFSRLHQLGVEHVFGVPGDFNLLLLEELQELQVPRWVGTANELGASYAADGYARKRGFGAFLTTYGVGELSAINGVAGSFAEQVPVLHIVGSPSSTATELGLPLHHTLLDGDPGHFERAYREVTVAQARLDSDRDPAEQIDAVLQAMLDCSLPGYISIPEDLVSEPLASGRLLHPLAPTVSSPQSVGRVAQLASRVLDRAERIVVLAGGGVNRAGAEERLLELAEAAALPVATLLDAKGVVDEAHPLALGVYQGAIGASETREIVEGADVLVRVGARVSDTLTGGFSARLDDAVTIELELDHAVIDGERVGNVLLADGLSALQFALADRISGALRVYRGERRSDESLDPGALSHEPLGLEPLPDADSDPEVPLTQADLWKRVASSLSPGTTVLADAGTSYYGIGVERFPAGAQLLGQPIWSSIGYCLPATLGVALARPQERPVLLIGDGAAQMTIQDLGTIAREGLHPIIVLVNNDGYTIERAIRGPESGYNDITRWDWAQIARGMTSGSEAITVLDAKTAQDLDRALRRAQMTPDQLVMIEVHVDRHDVPRSLKAMVGMLAQRAA
jgi:indolepyruvate decarboxylase